MGASIAASTVNTNITDTNPNDVFRGNVDINIEHYDGGPGPPLG